VRRRDFLALGAGGGAALLGGAMSEQSPAKAAAAVNTFRLDITDGYAYVFSNQRKNLLVGGIDVPAMGGNPGQPHPLILRVGKGTVKNPPPIAPVSGTTDQYDLSGHYVELDLNVGEKPEYALDVPSASWPEVMHCPTRDSEWDNLAWLPPVSKLYAGDGMATDWFARLSSCVAIRQGFFSVLKGDSEGIWEFKTGPKAPAIWTQPLSDRTRLDQVLLTTDTIYLKLYRKGNAPPAAGDNPISRFEITAANTAIALELATSYDEPSPMPYPIGQGVAHFARYHSLLNSKKAHVLPHFFPCEDGKGASPGDFCPLARYEL
jgi:hypothetical protein